MLCKKCQKDFSDEFTFCPFCGYNNQTPKNKGIVKKKINKPVNTKWIIVIVVLLALIGSIFAIPKLFSKKLTREKNNVSGEINYGNINNQGMVEQIGDWIYFTNTSGNQNHLYKMKSDGSNITRINDCSTDHLLQINKQLFYYRAYSSSSSPVCYLHKKSTTDDSETIIKPYISGNSFFRYVFYKDFLYYQGVDHYLYKVRLDESNRSKVSNEKIDKSFCIVNDWIYFINSSLAESLYRIKVVGSGLARVGTEEEIREFLIYQGEIFFLNSNNDLFKMDIKGKNKLLLTPDALYSFNTKGNWVFFKNKADNEFLYKIDLNGKSKQKVNDEHSSFINIVGDWIYYVNEKSEFIRMKDDGTGKQNLTKEIRDIAQERRNQQDLIDKEKYKELMKDREGAIEISLLTMKEMYKKDKKAADSLFIGKKFILSGTISYPEMYDARIDKPHVWFWEYGEDKSYISAWCGLEKTDPDRIMESKTNNYNFDGKIIGTFESESSGYFYFVDCKVLTMKKQENKNLTTTPQTTTDNEVSITYLQIMQMKDSVKTDAFFKDKEIVLKARVLMPFEKNYLNTDADYYTLKVYSTDDIFFVNCQFSRTEVNSVLNILSKDYVKVKGKYKGIDGWGNICMTNCTIVAVSKIEFEEETHINPDNEKAPPGYEQIKIIERNGIRYAVGFIFNNSEKEFDGVSINEYDDQGVLLKKTPIANIKPHSKVEINYQIVNKKCVKVKGVINQYKIIQTTQSGD